MLGMKEIVILIRLFVYYSWAQLSYLTLIQIQMNSLVDVHNGILTLP